MTRAHMSGPRFADLDRTFGGGPGVSSGGRFWVSRSSRQAWAVLVSALVAPLVGGNPVGSILLDWGWSAGLAGLGAFLGVRSKRGPLILVGLIAVLSARSGASLLFGTVAVVTASLSTRHLRRRAVFSRGMAGGLAVISLLATSDHARAVPFTLAAVATLVLLGGSGYSNARSGERRWLRWGAIGAIVLCGLASAAAVVGVADKGGLVDAGTAELHAGLTSARAGDAAGAAVHLERAQLALADARTGVDRWGTLARLVPVSAQHVTAITAVLGHVEQAIGFASQAAGIADDGLAVTAGTVDVEAVAALQGPLTRLVDSFADVVREIDRRADGPLLPALVDRLDRLRVEAVRAHHDASLGAAAAAAMPGVLGEAGPRRYLVVFTSPAEARGRFGFPGSFAEVTFVDGRYRLGEHGSTSQLLLGTTYDQAAFDAGAPQLRPYLPYGATRSILSSTISPDFPSVAEVLREMWQQSGRQPIDGVVRFDPTSIARLMSFTGPVTVSSREEPVTADNVEQFLLIDQYLQYTASQTQAPRRELLDEVAETTFERLETADLPAPRELIDIFRSAVIEQHLQVALFDRRAQPFITAVGLDGAFPAPAVDGFAVTTVNGLGNKIDSFLERTITYRGEIDDQQADTTLELTLTNNAPSGGLPDYVIGSFAQPAPPRGTNKMAVLVYTALPLESAEVDSRARLLESTRSGEWWLHQIEVTLPAGGTSTVALHLAGEVPEGPYHLVLHPSGGTRPDTAEVDLRVDGRRLHHNGRTLGPTHLE